MKTSSALLALCEETGHRSPVDSHHKGQWRGALMFSLIRAWRNGPENNRYVGDLRRHRAHYDVTVVCIYWQSSYLTRCDPTAPYGSILASVMGCCLTRPSHYLNQYSVFSLRRFCVFPFKISITSARCLFPIYTVLTLKQFPCLHMS